MHAHKATDADAPSRSTTITGSSDQAAPHTPPVREVDVSVRVNTSESAEKSLEAFATDLLHLIAENLERMAPEQVRQVREMLAGTDIQDYLSVDFWRGIAMVLGYQIKEQVDFVQRRLQGDYQTDPYGMDYEIIEMFRPLLAFMYRTWWRTTTVGIEHVPEEGRALLVSNHSGVLPWDGAMIATSVYEEHTSPRVVRNLFLHWFSSLPFVSPFLSSMGQVQGVPENAIRLLEEDQLVCVFPEGVKGVGKLFQDRYRLARFGRGGFVQAALRTGAPLLPIAVVGAEETYPMLANVEPVARMLGTPYFPLTPFFPWLGPLGFIPLPTHWTITFCSPISTAEYGPAAADDPLIVFMLTEQVRGAIQSTIDATLKERTSIF